MRRSRPIVTTVALLAGASLLLTGCGSKSGNSSSGGGGKLDVFVGAQPNYPDQFAAWSKDVTAKFKAATGADLTIETFSSGGDETTKI